MSAEWLNPAVDAPDWPVEVVEALDCTFGVPASWAVGGARADQDQFAEQRLWRGASGGDGLHLARLGAAEPGVARWMAAVLAASGSPCPELWSDLPTAPKPKAWGPVAAGDLAPRRAVDEAAAYHGRAAWAQGYLAIYVVLARRGTRAWRLTLVLESACPPGAPPDVIAANDHVRAAATFGRLAYLA